MCLPRTAVSATSSRLAPNFSLRDSREHLSVEWICLQGALDRRRPFLCNTTKDLLVRMGKMLQWLRWGHSPVQPKTPTVTEKSSVVVASKRRKDRSKGQWSLVGALSVKQRRLYASPVGFVKCKAAEQTLQATSTEPQVTPSFSNLHREFAVEHADGIEWGS